MAPLRIGYLMDPLETVRVDHDSTFALMLEAQKRGHTVHYFEQGWLRFNGKCAEARMRHVTVRREPGRHFDVLDEAVRPLSELDVLFLRKDPPVDAEFLHATHPHLHQRPGGHPRRQREALRAALPGPDAGHAHHPRAAGAAGLHRPQREGHHPQAD
jgi:hypothetical protein